MMPKKLWIWNLVLMFLPLVITLMILPHLPNQIPAHYGFDGQVDRWGSKYETLVVPLLAIITGGILLLAAKFAGKAEDGGQNNRRVTLLGSIIALLVFNAMTLYFLYTDMAQVTDLTALHLDLFQLLFGLWGVGMVILGNIMPKLRRNSLVGLRTPWSQSSEVVWKKSQRVGGILFMAAGILMIVFCFLLKGVWCFVAGILVILVGSMVAVWYSYWAAKRYGEAE